MTKIEILDAAERYAHSVINAEEFLTAVEAYSSASNGSKPHVSGSLLAVVRQAVADYMYSEGCSCCRGSSHDEDAARLAKLLKVKKYSDGSGYDFYRYRSKQ
jgi:hypothetical protein